MILDDFLVMADAQSSTVSAASTDYIDTKAAGDAYEGAWFVFRVDTLFASTGTVTCEVQLQTSPATNFTDSGTATLISSSALAFSTFTAGYMFKARIPSGCKRYLRGYKVVSPNTGGNYATSAIYDMFIVKDPLYANWTA
jgi:hypothetical protein